MWSFQLPRYACLKCAVRRAIDHVVERPRHAAQILGQRRPARRQAREHEAAIALDARRARQVPVGAPRVEVRVAVRLRHADQAAVEPIGPAVVGTHERARVAVGRRADLRAAMGAPVVQRRDRAVRLAHEQELGAPDAAAHEIAGARQTALVRDVDPQPAEDALELELEHRRVGIDATMNAPGLDQRGDLVGRERHGSRAAVGTAGIMRASLVA
jgi:hypothetical protein